MTDKRNASGDVFRPATYTTSVSQDMANEDGKFLHLILDVETAGTGNLTLTIRGKARSARSPNTGSSIYYTILAGAAVSSASTTVYRVGPGLTAAANAVANDILPMLWNVEVVMSSPSAWTFSVQYNIVE